LELFVCDPTACLVDVLQPAVLAWDDEDAAVYVPLGVA
jgi:hypothetical protein